MLLSVAGYNAGPGNVRKWLDQNGDPRYDGIDVIDWIERIPFSETRGYVQRVLENAVVYDTLNPSGARAPELLIVVTGSNDAFVESSLTATILAPAARLTLGANVPTTFVGTFHARDLVVRTDVTVRRGFSAPWSHVPACRALSASERAEAIAAGLNPIMYGVPGRETLQTWPIAYGQRWLVGLRYESGVGRAGTSSRFRVLSIYQNQVRGGNTFVLRQ